MLYVTGGSDGSYLDEVWASVDGSGFAVLTDAPGWDARWGHVLLAYEGYLWLMEGEAGGAGVQDDVWKSADGITWTLVKEHPDIGFYDDPDEYPRHFANGLVYDDKMWVMFGHNDAAGGSYQDDVWYSIDGENWTQATAGATAVPRCFAAACVYDGKMWVMGGETTGAVELNDVWYSTDGVTWTQASAGAAWAASSKGVAFVVGDVMMFYDTSLKKLWKTTDGAAWTEVTLTTEPGVKQYPAFACANGAAYMVGGEATVDTWRSNLTVHAPKIGFET
jgi:hypothetical protein